MSLRDEIVRLIDELVIATEDGHVIGDVGTTADAIMREVSVDAEITLRAMQDDIDALKAREAKLVEALEDFGRTLRQHKVGDEMPVTLFIAFDSIAALATVKEGK